MRLYYKVVSIDLDIALSQASLAVIDAPPPTEYISDLIIFEDADVFDQSANRWFWNSGSLTSDNWLIDPRLIENGATAYLGAIIVNDGGAVTVQLSPSGGIGSEAGPNFTNAFEQNASDLL